MSRNRFRNAPQLSAALWLVVALLNPLAGCAEPSDDGLALGSHAYHTSHSTQFKLPDVLREISGLTLDARERLYAHNDERGIIYRIDYRQGRVVSRFALGDGIRDDFEGIAVADERIFLVTSNGTLYESVIGDADETLDYQRYPAQLDCEVEGLTYSAVEQRLLVACKNLFDQPGNEPEGATALRIHKWNLEQRRYEANAVLSVSARTLAALPHPVSQSKIKKLQLTGIAVAGNGNLLLLAGRQHLLLELTPEGVPVRLFPLQKSRHHQTEGIAITSTGLLLLADEGDGKGSKKTSGRLTAYEPDS